MPAITEFLPVKGDPAALQQVFADDPGLWLPAPHHLGNDRWRTVVHGAGFIKPVVAHVIPAWRSGSTLWRRLSWEALVDEREPERVARYLPTMDGELGLHAVAGRSSLVLEASYQPPGGALGATLDALALRRVARQTTERFLAAIATGVSGVVGTDVEGATQHDGPPSADR